MLYKTRIHLDETVGVLASSACSVRCCIFYIKWSLKNTIHVGNLQSSSNVPLHIAGLRVDKSKNVIIKNWNIIWGERIEVPKFAHRNTIDNLLQSKNIHFSTFFSTTPNFSNATNDIG